MSEAVLMGRGTAATAPATAPMQHGSAANATLRELAELDPVRFALELMRRFRTDLTQAFMEATQRSDGDGAWWEGFDRCALRAPLPSWRPGHVLVSFARWNRHGESLYLYDSSAAFQLPVTELVALAETLEAGGSPVLAPRRPFVSFELSDDL